MKKQFNTKMTPNQNELGLRGAWRRSEGCSLSMRIKRLRGELRLAWQRGWRGYDAIDVGDFGYRLGDRVVVLLKEFARENDCLFKDPDTGRDLSKEETDAVIAELISLFEASECPGEKEWQAFGKWAASLWY